MGLDVQHGGPDPHGREDLNQGEAPVREDEPQSFEQHGKGADGHPQGREYAPAGTQVTNCGLNGPIVAIADGDHQDPDPAEELGATETGVAGSPSSGEERLAVDAGGAFSTVIRSAAVP